MMSFLTAPGIDRTIVTEEPIEHCCSILKHVIQGMLVPVFQLNAEGTQSDGERGTTTSKTNLKANVEEKNEIVNNDDIEITRVMAKPLSRAILNLCGNVLPLIEKLEVLVINIKLDDRLILSLVGASLSTLPIICEPNDIPSRLIPLHHHSLALLVAIFENYEHHRIPIIDDLFPIMLKLSTLKKYHRLFKLNILSKRIDGDASQDSIQAVSGLMMLLIQCCVSHEAKGNPKDDTR